MRVYGSVAELAVGESIGPGPWFTIDQERVDAFAEATGDHQWIHTDPERAAAGPFRGTIAHGFLTLALLPMLTRDLYRVDGLRMAVNYGLNRVRFPAPARVGNAVRLTAQVTDVTPVSGGVQLVVTATVDTDRGGKPCCVAETVSRLYPSD
jgi:acyl dehydratase